VRLRFIPIVLLLSVAGLPAQAGLRKCERHQLTHADYSAVRMAISKAAGGREVQWPLEYVCVNHNNASASVDLKSEPQPDTSSLDFHLSCSRGLSKWVCELDQTRSARVELDLDPPRTFELELPLGFDIQRVKPLLELAHEVGTKTTAEQMCGPPFAGPVTQRDSEWLQTSHDTFRFAAQNISGEIEQSPGTVSLNIGFEVLEFEPDSNNTSRFTFRCWTFMIIVA
jgi:hypothetical protein